MKLRESLYDHCQTYGGEELLRQWHPSKNGSLTPQEISYGSKQKVWWQCAEGHEWQTSVYTRTGAGSGCPYCSGRRVQPGCNDLASQYPELAAQWHPTKNGRRSPDAVSPGSHAKVWWKCEKGHEWQALVKSRASGCGCPVCANRTLLPGQNDLASQHPELVRQWHPTRNRGLTPQNIVAGTRKKVWWQCERGHAWQATVASRAKNGTGCPVCAGKAVIPGENDLASQFPEVADQWHPDKNGVLTAEGVSPYSNRRVWWRCELGHEYPAVIATRTMNGSDCPYCVGRKALAGFNDLATLEPQIAAQWHPAMNGGLTPQMVTAGSHKKVWWQCPDGHIWKAVIYSRAGPQKCGCPVCAGKVEPRKQARYRDMQAAGKIIAAGAVLK